MYIRSLAQRHGFDLIVLVVAVVAQVAVWTSDYPGPEIGLSAFALACTLPLFARRRFPFAAGVAVAAAAAAESLVYSEAFADASIASPITVALASWTVGVLNERREALTGLVLFLASGAVFTRALNDKDVGTYIFVALILVVPLGLGRLVRARELQAAEARAHAERVERERAERARAAVAEERGRIARELHDVVAHSISVMTIQAGAARMLVERDPARADSSLKAIEATGRQTMTEMRRLVAVMTDGAPGELEARPSLANLRALVAQVEDAGLDVSLAVEGEDDDLPPGVDLAAYRIVQEALTNVLKHARAAHAEVTVRRTAGAIGLEITDDGVGGGARGHSGHGLVGMRERVAVYGGAFEAAPRAHGGFRVAATLPIERVTA